MTLSTSNWTQNGSSRLTFAVNIVSQRSDAGTEAAGVRHQATIGGAHAVRPGICSGKEASENVRIGPRQVTAVKTNGTHTQFPQILAEGGSARHAQAGQQRRRTIQVQVLVPGRQEAAADQQICHLLRLHLVDCTAALANKGTSSYAAAMYTQTLLLSGSTVTCRIDCR